MRLNYKLQTKRTFPVGMHLLAGRTNQDIAYSKLSIQAKRGITFFSSPETDRKIKEEIKAAGLGNYIPRNRG